MNFAGALNLNLTTFSAQFSFMELWRNLLEDLVGYAIVACWLMTVISSGLCFPWWKKTVIHGSGRVLMGLEFDLHDLSISWCWYSFQTSVQSYLFQRHYHIESQSNQIQTKFIKLVRMYYTLLKKEIQIIILMVSTDRTLQ